MSSVESDPLRHSSSGAPPVASAPPGPPPPPPPVVEPPPVSLSAPDNVNSPPPTGAVDSRQRATPPSPPSPPRSATSHERGVAPPVAAPTHFQGRPPSPMDALDGAQAEEDESNPVATTIKASPPWLISCLVHMVLIIALGLIPFLASQTDEIVELVVGNTEDAGEVMDLDTMDDEALLNPDDFMQVLPDDVVVEDPMASAEPLEISTDDLLGALDLEAPKMGLMLSGREEGMKKFLLAAYGGSDKTQAAVLYGLNWLAKKQDSDGLWSLTGRFRTDAKSKSATYRDGSHDENKCAATALAMLAFQGYGQSHFDGPHEMFRLAVEKGMKGLLRCQAADGSFTKNARVEQPHLTRHHLTYTQAMCAFALSELYAMTKDSSLRVPAQKAIDYLVENQDRLGGWKYQPGTGADLSVTGWVMMALQSARMAELEVPQTTLYAIEGFLDKVARDGGRKYAYDAFRPQWSLAMTAEGLLCRQYLGWSQDDEKMVDGAKLLAANPIEFNTEYQDVYYWYYATQVLHNMEDDNWNRWNAVMKRELPARQVMEGKETGSWDPEGDAWGPHGGRLYVTALSIFMLETYYRHLPIYSQNFGNALDKGGERRAESGEPEGS